MSPPATISAHGLRLLIALPLVHFVQAADGLWANPGGGSWMAGANWNGGGIAGGSGAGARFDTLDLTRDVVVTLDGPRTVGGLVFGDPSPSHDWFLRGGSGGDLTLAAASGAPVIEVAGRTATLGVALAGVDGLVKSGTGTLVLSGSNKHSGPTMVAAGTLRLGTPPVFPQGLRIMPIGDSITYGSNGDNAGYRGPLHDLLVPIAPDFRYVGTSNQRPGSLPSQPVDQRYHEGHSSYRIQDVNNNLDGYDNARFLQYGGPERNPNGGYWLTGGGNTGRGPLQPEIIAMMIGTNDLDHMPGVETRLRALLSKLTALCPDTRLLVATITPVVGYPVVNTYNEMLVRVVEEYRAAGSKVFLLDLNAHFPSDGLDPDGVHPNNAGFKWMALQWHDAIIRACSPEGGTTHALPADSAVTVARRATLDLHGTRTVVGTVSSAGVVDLGNGGDLTALATVIQSSGVLAGSGTVRGNVVLHGGGFGFSGQSVWFTGPVTSNGLIEPGPGSALHFGGGFTNNGIFTTGSGQSLVFTQGVTNNGILCVTDGPIPDFGAILINNGILELQTGLHVLPENFINNGLVVDSSVLETHSFSLTGNTVTLTIHARAGGIYQLQHSSTMAAASWQDVGLPQTGAAGTLLTFSAERNPSAARGFYRIRETGR